MMSRLLLAAFAAAGGGSTLATAECVVTTDCKCPSDGVAPATSCLRKCIASCSAAAGSAGATVRFPAGTYLTGALNLTSSLTVQLDEGAEILGSLDAADYPLVPALPGYGITRDEPVPAAHLLVRHQALISGWNISGATVQGKGTINGQGQVLGHDGKSWYTRVHQYGRPRLVEPMFCNDFHIEGLQLQNSAFWTLHPYACDGVTIRGLNITARSHSAPNSDGIDPDSSRNVLVEDCFVDVGDDTVAIKSGMDYAGRHFAHPAENILFRNCHFVQNAMAIGSAITSIGHFSSLFVRFSSVFVGFLGSLSVVSGTGEQSGGVRNVTFENIIMGPRHAPFTEGAILIQSPSFSIRKSSF